MRWNDYQVSANVSLLFAEVDYPDRFAAAAAAGFTAVESWWPFPEPHPGKTALDELIGWIADAGVRLTGLNFFAGDMPGGERGIACDPGRGAELDAGTEALLHVARATGCQGFNLLYGQLDEGGDLDRQRAAAVGAYRRAAEAVAEIDGVVLVEALASGLNGAYPLTDLTHVNDLIEQAGVDRLAILFDTFHLGRNGVDLPQAIAEHAGRVGHVQIADTPDRGEPGSGDLDWDAVGAALRSSGYQGTVAAEYKPTRDTAQTLSWLEPSTV